MCLMVSDAAEEIVDNSAQLLAALQNNSVETIVLDKDIELGPEFDQYQGGSPLLINRLLLLLLLLLLCCCCCCCCYFLHYTQ
jgi:hypothetical protein